jgi:hypothetical protein
MTALPTVRHPDGPLLGIVEPRIAGSLRDVIRRDPDYRPGASPTYDALVEALRQVDIEYRVASRRPIGRSGSPATGVSNQPATIEDDAEIVWMATREAADVLGVTDRQVRDYVTESHLLTGRKFGRCWKVDAATVALLAEKRGR